MSDKTQELTSLLDAGASSKRSTLADWVKVAVERGHTSSDIALAFNTHTGVDLRRLPKETRLADLPTVVQTLKAQKADDYRQPEPPGMLERAAKWAGGVAVRAPAVAAGALKELGTAAGTPDPQAMQAQFEGYRVPGSAAYSRPKVRAEMERQTQEARNRIAEAGEANKQLRQKRADTSTATTVSQDIGDMIAGAGKMMVGNLLNMEGPVGESPIDAAKRGLEFGREAAAGAVGGPADMAKGVFTEGWDTNPLRTQTVSTAASLLPAARAAKLVGLAGAETAAARGGMVGKVGSGAAKVLRATDEMPKAAGEWVSQKATAALGGEKLLAELAERVKAGELTPENAAKIMQKHTPFETVMRLAKVSERSIPVVRAAVKVGKSAAMGALLGDSYVGPVMGAAGGAALGLVGEGLRAYGAHLERKTGANPVAEAEAAYQRNVNDPAAQANQGVSESLRQIIDPPVQKGAEVRDLFKELGGLVGRGEVGLNYQEKPKHFNKPHGEHYTVDPTTGRVELRDFKGGEWDPKPIEPTPTMKQHERELADAVRLAKADFEASRGLAASPSSFDPARLSDAMLRIHKTTQNPQAVVSAAKKALDDARAALERQKKIHADVLERQRLAKRDLVKPGQSVREAMDIEALGLGRVIDAADEINALAEKSPEAKPVPAHIQMTVESPSKELGVPVDEINKVLKLQPEGIVDKAQLEHDLKRMRSGEPTWPMGLAKFGDLAERTGADLRFLSTTNRRFEHAVNRLRQTMTDMGQGERIDPTWFNRVATDVLNQSGLGKLYDPAFRGKVIENIAKRTWPEIFNKKLRGLHGKQWRAFRKDLDDKLIGINKELLGDVPKSMVFKDRDGVEFTLEDAVADVTRNTKERDLRRHQQAAMQHIGNQLAVQAEDAHLAAAIGRDQTRFIPVGTGANATPQGVKTEAAYATNLLAGILGDRSQQPAFLVYNPSRLASLIRTRILEGQIPPGMEQGAARLANVLETRYEPAKPATADYIAKQRNAGLLPETPGEGFWVEKGVNSSLEARVKLLTSMRMLNWWDRLQTQIKLNYTAYRPATAINNIASNLMQLFLTEGVDPITSMTRDVAEARRMSAVLHGESATAAEVNKWQSFSKNGLSAIGDMNEEIAAMSALSSPHGVVQATMHHAGKIARDVYQMGDAPFKVGKASRYYDTAMSDLATLGDGEWARLRLSGNRAMDLRAATNKGRKGVVYNRRFYDLNSQALADLIGKAAVERAQESFINTAHSPAWILKLRASRAAFASPFLSWGWGALELPGKPGLLSRMLEFDGGALLDTNNPQLLARNAARAMEVAMRRSVLLSAMRANLNPNRDLVRDVLPFLYGDPGTADIVGDADDPLTVSVKNFDAMNPLSRANLVWRVAEWGIGHLFGPNIEDMVDDPKKMDWESMSHEERRRAEAMSRLWAKQQATVKDAMDLFLLSGNTLFDFARDLNDASDPRGNKDVGHVFLDFTLKSLLPAVAVDAAKLTAGWLDPYNTWSKRPRLELGENAGPMDIGTAAVEKMLNLAYRKVNLMGDRGKIKAFLTKAAEALNESLVRERERKADQMAMDHAAGRITKAEFDKQVLPLYQITAMAQAFVDLAKTRMEVRLLTGALDMAPAGTTEADKDAMRRSSVPSDEGDTEALPADSAPPSK